MRPTRFERVMFATLVPALALPIITATLVIWVQPGPLYPDDPFGPAVSGPFFGVFMVVLLGSMTLNAWLLLRRPVNLESRSIPRLVGRALVLLYLTVAVWIGMLFLVPVDAAVFTVLALAVMLESILVFVLVFTTRQVTPARFAESRLAPIAKWGLITYVLVAVTEVITGALLLAQPSFDWVPYWTPVVTALGLPWSPAVALFDFASLASDFIWGGYSDPSEPRVPFEIPLLMLPVIINVVLAAGVLVSAKSRAIALRLLFFRGTERPAKD